MLVLGREEDDQNLSQREPAGADGKFLHQGDEAGRREGSMVPGGGVSSVLATNTRLALTGRRVQFQKSFD